MSGDGLLAGYLTARRQLVTPEQVGLPAPTTHRRVPGLRREEVAMLAGISSDYYLRMEQGRELSPSPTVVDGLIKALCLDGDAALYLHEIARPSLGATRQSDALLSASTMELVESMRSTPVYVATRYLDILYANDLFDGLEPRLQVGQNIVKIIFEADRPRNEIWQSVASRAVAAFRSGIDPLDNSHELLTLLAELHQFDYFSEYWERQDTFAASGMPIPAYHVTAGMLALRLLTFRIPATGGQVLGMYVAEPGSESAAKLAALAS
ncbi:helix-turn-helix transcriptional regulator [Subtercola vilae]|uniref:XRE family transcriptional regulator n=1 Tax=Subtercola vilae TaxID=2056433 RepID=A0A4T2C0D5_9MICO|nr:helix-turn-helix transcriptional regulator [Subtercola vilae]TIH37370.1 XRE family transcriptional regulator [Subtercola vilae]